MLAEALAERSSELTIHSGIQFPRTRSQDEDSCCIIAIVSLGSPAAALQRVDSFIHELPLLFCESEALRFCSKRWPANATRLEPTAVLAHRTGKRDDNTANCSFLQS